MNNTQSVRIALDVHDDVVAAQQKIIAAPGGAVMVEIPSGSSIKNRTSFNILLQSAESNGKQITFTSGDSMIASVIQSLGGKTPAESPVVSEPPQSAFIVGHDVATDLPEVNKRAGGRETVVSRIRGIVVTFFANFLEAVQTRAALSIGGVLVTVVVILGVMYALYTAAHSATIRLVVKPESIVKSFEVSASPSAESVDTANKKIPATLFEFSEVSTEATKTSTNQVIGEKAKGFVTIYNKTDDLVDFPKGTKLTLAKTEGEDLLYYLDDAVRVDARVASTDDSDPGSATVTYTNGRETVAVTAAQIGDDYNVKDGQTFAVEDFSVGSYIAQNDQDFSGGNRKEVTVVAQADYDRLLASLTEKLTTAVKDRAQKELQEGDVIVPLDAIEVVEVSRAFTQELGAVADEVSLTLEVKGVAYTYNKSDLEELLSDALGGFVPERFTLADEDQTIALEGVQVQQNELTFFAKVRGQAIPKIDTDKLRNDIRGRRISLVQAYLGSFNVVESYEIELFPSVPYSFQVMPRNTKKITVEVKHTVDAESTESE